MSAQCRHGTLRYECPKCHGEPYQSPTQQLEIRDDELRKLRALLRECLPRIDGHLRDKVMQTLGSE